MKIFLNIILFLNNIMDWLGKEDIYNMLRQKCNEKDEDEKGETIENVLQQMNYLIYILSIHSFLKTVQWGKSFLIYKDKLF